MERMDLREAWIKVDLSNASEVPATMEVECKRGMFCIGVKAVRMVDESIKVVAGRVTIKDGLLVDNSDAWLIRGLPLPYKATTVGRIMGVMLSVISLEKGKIWSQPSVFGCFACHGVFATAI